MKTAIIYYSKHHENTKKLLDVLAAEGDVTLINAANGVPDDLSCYDRIGFASGIYYSKFHKSVINCAAEHLPDGKEVFFIFTCGAEKDSYTNAIAAACAKHNAKILGEFGCLGYDTFGPFKLVGGIAKGHPDANDLSNALQFFKAL